MERDETQSEVDPCIFKGHLEDELDSEVLVTGGCPGSDTFDVSFLKTERQKDRKIVRQKDRKIGR
jgi:hypothetical protein